MTKSVELTPDDLECLEIGRGIKLAGLRLAMQVLRGQMETLEQQLYPAAPNGAIKPAMLRTLKKAGIALPQLPAPQKEGKSMIGKVKVSTPNPPCKGCGGMGGYHRKDCKVKRAKDGRSSGIKGYWASMTPEARSAEMKRRALVHAGAEPAKPRVKLVQPNHPRNVDHPDHEAWMAKMRKANRKSWNGLTPEARKARIGAALAGRGLKPKS